MRSKEIDLFKIDQALELQNPPMFQLAFHLLIHEIEDLQYLNALQSNFPFFVEFYFLKKQENWIRKRGIATRVGYLTG